MDDVTLMSDAEGAAHLRSKGLQYLKSFKGGRNRPEIFTPDILLSMAGMALEHLLAGAAMARGLTPQDQSSVARLKAIGAIAPIPDDVTAAVKLVGSKLGGCGSGGAPKDADAETINELVDAVQTVADYFQHDP